MPHIIILELLLMRYKMQINHLSLDEFNRSDNTKSDSMSAHVRVVHVATKAPNVDVYINDKLTIPNLKYREFTDYLKIPAGTYNIKLYEANTKAKPLLDVDVFVPPKSITTLAAVSQDRNLSIYPLDETAISNPTKGKVRLRFAQFIENMPPVDVLLSNGTILYKNLNFKDLKNYIELPPNTYAFVMNLADTDIPLLYVPNATLLPDQYVTIYLIGLLSDYPEPQMLIPLDGITYIK